MNTEYQVYFFENFIEKYAQATGKCVAYIRTYGWNNTSDIDKINESISLYEDLLPTDFITVMKNSEFIFVEIEDISEAIDFFESYFPENQENCEPANYVHFSLYNHLGQIVLSN